MPQQEFVIEIVQPTDPELEELVPVREVAHYWKSTEEFARRRLREHGVRFLRVDYPLMVRWSDVQEFEKAHTIILGVNRKEVATTS
jgi:hypothetical protein